MSEAVAEVPAAVPEAAASGGARPLILIAPAGSDDWCWWPVNADGPAAGEGDVTALASACDECTPILVWPAESVLLREVGFTSAERRLLRRTIPYSLEDELGADVDQLHFALARPEGEQVTVAITAAEPLAAALETLRAAGIDPARAVPEQLLARREQQCWTLTRSGHRWLLRHGVRAGFAIEAQILPTAVELLAADQGLPEAIDCDHESMEDAARLLPPDLAAKLRAQSLRAQDLEAAAALDLLQGRFAHKVPWSRWWRQWRLPLVAFAAVLVLQLLVAALDLRQLRAENVELRRAIETTYREVIPGGALTDPVLQLQRQVRALEGDGGAGLLPLLQQFGAALAEVESSQLENFSFSQRQNEIRATVVAARFADIEVLRETLAKRGLNAELAGTSNVDAGTRARLRIGGRK